MATNTAVTPVDGKTYFGTGTATVAKKSSAELNTQDFLTIMTTQLANQNPLEPVKDTDYFAQLAQLGTVQGIDTLKASAEITQANSLIGKTVSAPRPGDQVVNGGSTQVVGVVQGLTIKDGTRYLEVKEANGGIAEITMDSVQQVADSGATNTIDRAINLAQSAQLVGKTITAPHPTLKGADGKPEELTGAVKSVKFENGSVFLTVTDRLGHDVKVDLQNVEQFGQ